MGTWDALLAPGMPGVVAATLIPARGAERNGSVQWWRQFQVAADGDYQLGMTACKMEGTAEMLEGMRRGDRAVVAGREYQAVTDAESDDHEWYVMYLEPLP